MTQLEGYNELTYLDGQEHGKCLTNLVKSESVYTTYQQVSSISMISY